MGKVFMSISAVLLAAVVCIAWGVQSPKIIEQLPLSRMSEHYEDSFKAPLLWVLDPKNIRDIEAGDYDTQQIESN